MKEQDPNMEKMVLARDHKVYFSSSRGKQFQVSVRKSAAGAAVLMGQDQAVKMGKDLGAAERLATFVNERVRP